MTSQKNTSVIDSTHFISKAPSMFKKYNDIDLISEVLNSLDSKVKMRIDFILLRPSAKMYYWKQIIKHLSSFQQTLPKVIQIFLICNQISIYIYIYIYIFISGMFSH
jgi:hypothetical protein